LRRRREDRGRRMQSIAMRRKSRGANTTRSCRLSEERWSSDVLLVQQSKMKAYSSSTSEMKLRERGCSEKRRRLEQRSKVRKRK
jgi:hypothetical protein